MKVRRSLLSILASLLLLVVPLVAHAETKVLTAESTYIMGDGESPSYAEAMVLQKAKQMALEEAGTYVESYTKVQNFDLTTEEIQTIAGGVLQVEVLDKSRTLISDGLRFYVKIKASVTTDKMEELTRRIKGKNVAEEYKKLQEDYARLGKEIESWKQVIAKTPSGPERDVALKQIQDRENAFAATQKSEAALFQRLVSGETLVIRAEEERTIVDNLFQKILEQGFLITIGEPTLHKNETTPESDMKLTVPVTLQTSKSIRLAMGETVQSLGGFSKVKRFMRSKHFIIGADEYQGRVAEGTVIEMGRDTAVSQYFHKRVGGLTFVLNVKLSDGDGWSCTDRDRNHDPYNFLYLEMNPIAPVIATYNEKKVWGWEIIRWVDDDGNVVAAGSRAPVHKDLGIVMQTNSVQVVAFDDIRHFSITMAIPSRVAQQIKSVSGEIKENPDLRSSVSSSGGKASMPMTTKNVAKKDDRQWWQQLFGSSGDVQDTTPEQPPQTKMKENVISCSIES